jgi:hypothetical protein
MEIVKRVSNNFYLFFDLQKAKSEPFRHLLRCVYLSTTGTYPALPHSPQVDYFWCLCGAVSTLAQVFGRGRNERNPLPSLSVSKILSELRQ